MTAALLFVLVCFPLAAGTDDGIVDALVAEEANCTRVNQTFELARMCKKDVIERLFLYVAVQQLHIARRREQRELEAMAVVEKQKEAREKEIDEGGKTALKIFVLFMLAIFVWMCLMSRPHGDEVVS